VYEIFSTECRLRRYPHKSRYFTFVGQSFVKMVADHYGHAAYHTSDELFSHVNIDVYEKL